MSEHLSTDFLIAGVRTRISSDRNDPPYSAMIEDLSAMRTTDPGEAECELMLHPRGWDEPSPLKLPADAKLLRSGGRKVFEHDGAYFIDFHEEAFFQLHAARMEGVCYWGPELDPMFWTEICLPYVLALLLRRRGLFLLHAGGAVSPDGTAMLFTGRSGAGKSTTAFRLAEAGWTYLGDDMVFYDAHYRIHAFPKLAAATEWTVERLKLLPRVLRIRPTGKRVIRPWLAPAMPPEKFRIFAPIPATFAKNSIAPLDLDSAVEILSGQAQFCHTDHIVGGPAPDLVPLAARTLEIRIGDLASLPDFLAAI
ncbi:MAG: hypothetical protein AAB229_04840 [Candidatus Hydrogenedentota bacterium]